MDYNDILILSTTNSVVFFVISSPDIDSRKARHGLLKSHKEVLGPASAFDGATLFLPKQLENPVSSDVLSWTFTLY